MRKASPGRAPRPAPAAPQLTLRAHAHPVHAAAPQPAPARAPQTSPRPQQTVPARATTAPPHPRRASSPFHTASASPPPPRHHSPRTHAPRAWPRARPRQRPPLPRLCATQPPPRRRRYTRQPTQSPPHSLRLSLRRPRPRAPDGRAPSASSSPAGPHTRAKPGTLSQNLRLDSDPTALIRPAAWPAPVQFFGPQQDPAVFLFEVLLVQLTITGSFDQPRAGLHHIRRAQGVPASQAAGSEPCDKDSHS